MKTIPNVGMKVRYKEKGRTCVGIVTRQYPGGWEVCEDETGEMYIQPDFVEIKVNRKPSWWCYPNASLMCAEISHISPLDK